MWGALWDSYAIIYERLGKCNPKILPLWAIKGIQTVGKPCVVVEADRSLDFLPAGEYTKTYWKREARA